MKKILKRTSLLLISALMSIAAAQAQKSPQDMDRFIDALMKKMTVEEKIGQLNLPVTGDITTGQAKSSDVAQKIEKGLVGGLFNLKGVDRILEVQKLAVEKSRLGIPLLFGMDVIHGYETIFPIPLGLSCTWDMAGFPKKPPISILYYREIRPYCSHRSKCRRHFLDIQSDGRHQSRPTLGTCQRGIGRRSVPGWSYRTGNGIRIPGCQSARPIAPQR